MTLGDSDLRPAKIVGNLPKHGRSYIFIAVGRSSDFYLGSVKTITIAHHRSKAQRKARKVQTEERSTW